MFQGVNHHEKEIKWYAENALCSVFLNVMAIWHGSFGGAASYSSVGYVDEKSARKQLDSAWQFIGEVNSMRTYSCAYGALCFLKWEDVIQMKRKLSAWRVFAAAATKKNLEEIHKQLSAEWESWGG